MKFLIIDSYYPKFLNSVISSLTEDETNYTELLDRLLRLRFGTADFYSRNLRSLGHEAEDIIFNCIPLQELWACENGFSILGSRMSIPHRIAKLSFIRKIIGSVDSLLDIAIRQIRTIRPDILYVQDLNLFPQEVLKKLREEGAFRLAVGQIACPLPSLDYLNGFDLILTSFPHYVDRFRGIGIKSEYFKIAFDSIVIDEIGILTKEHGCTFVGGLSPDHKERSYFLEYLAKNVDIKFFGYGSEKLGRDSPIDKRHQGECWGLDMYRTLAKSHITINHHIDVAENNANNMRLFEATGCGSLLITDNKLNISEMFEPDKEIVTYNSNEEAVEKINFYLENPLEAVRIASAGQKRTLREHTYLNRMEELILIINKYLK